MEFPKLDFNPIIKLSDRIDVQEIHLKAYKDASYQFYKTIYLRQMVDNFANDGSVPNMPSNPEMVKLIDDYRDRYSVKPPYILLTVNVRPGISFKDLKTKVEKYVKSNIVQEYLYCYEVRESDGEGLHCHLIYRYKGRSSDVRKSTKNTFKSVCEVNNPHCLNFKFVAQDVLPSKVDYVLGIKSDKKKKSLEIISEWRNLTKVEKYYESNPPLPCRVTLNRVTEVLPLESSSDTVRGHSDAKQSDAAGACDETKDDTPREEVD